MKEIGNHIIKRVRKGNNQAFQKLVQHYQHSIYTLSILMLGNEKKAEVLATETFLYAYSHINDYIKADMKFSVWLYQSMASLAQRQLEEGCNKRDAKMKISTEGILLYLLNIPFKKRLAIILNCCYHLSEREISEVLHTPRSEIRSYIYQVREKLAKELRCADSIKEADFLCSLG
ncbi:hypothetical protein D8M04_14040 [Oceanobacillus piezotolerans]|uniref:RNA polymerase sigma factor 70 region 4 type 2 domain-containing protein n=1 Tax=Oceanobacillus piezotolerans TaxID=2448030 RepID=A0A498D696_9BACI|nr:sigma factor-like helix-turn-helix DNA-binding protein [Oceanobacillus piezotolerans]RLL42674.1 hypothetical protein D8M04_14040 [Oceanobacillus piezotolerans]